MHGAQHVDAGTTEELEIEDNPMRLLFEDAVDCFSGRFRFADDVDAVELREQLGQPVANRNEVFDDEYLGAALRFHGCQYRHARGGRLSAAAEYPRRPAPNRRVGVRFAA